VQVNAILTSEDQTGKKQTTTITYLRQSEKSKAATLTQALNALTTNNYVGTQVNEINVDLTEKQTPILTLGEWGTPTANAALITYNGDGTLYISGTNPAHIIIYQNSKYLEVSGSVPFSGAILATETDNYKQAKITFSKNS